MKPTAFLDWSLDTECPHCGREVDLVKYDSDHGDSSIAKMIFTNRWDALADWEIECQHCQKEFKLDGVEY